MLYLKQNFPIKLITFYDDTFSWNKKWLRGFRDEVRVETRRQGNDLPPISVNARANTFDEEVAEILKEVGCIGVWFGFESGSPDILKLLDKGVDQNKTFVQLEYARKRAFMRMPISWLESPGRRKKTMC